MKISASTLTILGILGVGAALIAQTRIHITSQGRVFPMEAFLVTDRRGEIHQATIGTCMKLNYTPAGVPQSISMNCQDPTIPTILKTVIRETQPNKEYPIPNRQAMIWRNGLLQTADEDYDIVEIPGTTNWKIVFRRDTSAGDIIQIISF